MCGLIGHAGPYVGEGNINIRDELDKIIHRGPDAQGGQFVAEDIFLGATRLAIQDLDPRSDQPFHGNGITLTYNGEMWNVDAFPQRQKLTTGDTEVVASLLAEWGTPALDMIDGMFAVAWYDQTCLYLARDRWGKVPLYYQLDADNSLHWASEIKALDLTSPSEVKSLPPGHCIQWTAAGINVYPWTIDTPFNTHPPTPESVLSLLRKGVQERLIGQRSIGYMLSGGVDSSLILRLVCEELDPDQIQAYTGVLNAGSPDLQAARFMAHELGVKLHEVEIPPPNQHSIRAAVRTIEHPLKAQVEVALAHMPLMERMKADGHAVCLSGEAADELFGGYGGMQIKAGKATEEEWARLKFSQLVKMSYGNFSRVNKVGMRYGIECRLPFMQTELVGLLYRPPKSSRHLARSSSSLPRSWPAFPHGSSSAQSRPSRAGQASTSTPLVSPAPTPPATTTASPGNCSDFDRRTSDERTSMQPVPHRVVWRSSCERPGGKGLPPSRPAAGPPPRHQDLGDPRRCPLPLAEGSSCT